MKKMAEILTTAILSAVTFALAGVATPTGAPENPATGIWIQQWSRNSDGSPGKPGDRHLDPADW